MEAGLDCWKERPAKKERVKYPAVSKTSEAISVWERASEASPFMACGPTESSCCYVSSVLVLAVLELELEVVIGSEGGRDSRVWLCL